jgi:hypothetical protein
MAAPWHPVPAEHPALAYVHVPVFALHVAAPWHPVPAEHVPLLNVHVPVFALHEPPVWHPVGVQVPLPYEQAPVFALHVPAPWHPDPMEHVPATYEQVPVKVLHVPAPWHPLDLHTTGFDPVHTPLTHVSVCVHGLPSLQVVPLAASGFEQTPVSELHVPTV